MLPPVNTLIGKIKPLEHHIERHYEVDSDKFIFLQRMAASEEFFEDRLDHCLAIEELHEVNELLFEDYGTEDMQEEFEFLHYSTFITFFRGHNVDIPRCFRKTKSVRRAVNELDLLKLNNYLMRHGNRTKSWTTLSKTLSSLTELYISGLGFGSRLTLTWQELYLNMNYAAISGGRPLLLAAPKNEQLNFDRRLTTVGKHIEDDWSLYHVLMRNIQTVEPLFSFYIYKVDKKIFKNTRGKSGKFTFIWKYVSKYKRQHLVMFWLMKELRMAPGRTVYDRLLSVMNTIIFQPKTSWIYRVRRFSYNYVYFNSRKTLGETYRTSTK